MTGSWWAGCISSCWLRGVRSDKIINISKFFDYKWTFCREGNNVLWVFVSTQNNCFVRKFVWLIDRGYFILPSMWELKNRTWWSFRYKRLSRRWFQLHFWSIVWSVDRLRFWTFGSETSRRRVVSYNSNTFFRISICKTK